MRTDVPTSVTLNFLPSTPTTEKHTPTYDGYHKLLISYFLTSENADLTALPTSDAASGVERQPDLWHQFSLSEMKMVPQSQRHEIYATFSYPT